MRKIFVIKLNSFNGITLNAWASSSRHATFSSDFYQAALFHSEANAKKGFKSLTDSISHYGVYIDGQGHQNSPDFSIEIVQCTLTPDNK